VSALTDQLDTDIQGILVVDIPKSMTIGTNTVTCLVEEVKRAEENELGGYNLELSTRVWVRTAAVTLTPTIGNVITVDGASKRIVSYTKSLDDNMWMIDVDNPG
jgi:hypothetical protein